MLFINSAFTQDAGCPIFPMEFVEDITYIWDNNNFELLDLNLELYKRLKDYREYAMIKCIFGGYVAEYGKNAIIPLSEYRFEALPTANLILALLHSDSINDKWVIDEIKKVSIEYGIVCEKVKELLEEVNEIYSELSELVNETEIIMNMSSVSSVFAGIWFSKLLKNKIEINIVGIGNQINVPDISHFAMSSGLIDKVIDTVNTKERKIKLKQVLEVLKVQSNKYPKYYGLKIVPYQLSMGCPQKCNFCTERMCWNAGGQIKDKYRLKDIMECIEDIDYLINEYKVSGLTFNDCMVNFKLPIYKELVNYLISKDVFLSGSIRIDILDDDMLKILHSMRFTNLIIGLETLNQESVSIYNKGKIDYTKNALESIPKLQSYGIMPQINLIIDHPYESEENVLKSVDEIIEFSNYIKQKDVLLDNVNTGEILVNYPSDSYFKVMRDSNFTIVYQEVNEKYINKISINEAYFFERIPYKAEKKRISLFDKNTLVMKVSKVRNEDNISVINNMLATMMIYWEDYYKEWSKKPITFKINSNLNGNCDNTIINILLEKKTCTVADFEETCMKREFVENMLSLALLNVVNIEGDF